MAAALSLAASQLTGLWRVSRPYTHSGPLTPVSFTSVDFATIQGLSTVSAVGLIVELLGPGIFG